MCTVTLFPLAPGRTRIVCNRDEQRSRPPAQPPMLHAAEPGMRYLAPIDPLSQGTWIGVNQAGLAMCLLNRNTSPANTGKRLRGSRGMIVPALMSATDIRHAIALAYHLSLNEVAPFRLILCYGGIMAEMVCERQSWKALQLSMLSKPFMFTSSGLGDLVVDGCRRDLFEEMISGCDTRDKAQDTFHRHRWPGLPHLSVMMSRPDAATVSMTEITLDQHRTEMNYFTCNEGGLLPVSSHTLELRREQKPCQQYQQAK